jgi:hypothetical protein
MKKEINRSDLLIRIKIILDKVLFLNPEAQLKLEEIVRIKINLISFIIY